MESAAALTTESAKGPDSRRWNGLDADEVRSYVPPQEACVYWAQKAFADQLSAISISNFLTSPSERGSKGDFVGAYTLMPLPRHSDDSGILQASVSLWQMR